MNRFAILAALAVFGGAAAAQAASPSMTVAVKGRDLSTPQGARTYYKALVRASSEVCGGMPTRGGLAAISAYDDCFKATLAEAVSKTNAPLVAALAEKRVASARVASR